MIRPFSFFALVHAALLLARITRLARNSRRRAYRDFYECCPRPRCGERSVSRRSVLSARCDSHGCPVTSQAPEDIVFLFACFVKRLATHYGANGRRGTKAIWTRVYSISTGPATFGQLENFAERVIRTASQRGLTAGSVAGLMQLQRTVDATNSRRIEPGPPTTTTSIAPSRRRPAASSLAGDG
jgi:hypothetical protein